MKKAFLVIVVLVGFAVVAGLFGGLSGLPGGKFLDSNWLFGLVALLPGLILLDKVFDLSGDEKDQEGDR